MTQTLTAAELNVTADLDHKPTSTQHPHRPSPPLLSVKGQLNKAVFFLRESLSSRGTSPESGGDYVKIFAVMQVLQE